MVSTSRYIALTKKGIVRDFVFFSITFSLSLWFIDPVSAQVTSPSGYILVGTIQSPDFTGAVISVSKDEQFLYRLGDKLPDGSQVVKVQSDRILLRGSEGIAYEMYIAHGTKNFAAALPYSPSDPFAGKVRTPAAERPLSAYEKRRQKQIGTISSDDK